ncbi:amidase family protein [Kribbella sp. NPDC026611]|uniref:amidase family protein n=1 Tax=Kribbella sp. NPDC026611 TaxID=3154911 RepID=UPI0033DE38F6
MGSREEVERLLARIAAVDPLVRAICTLNPRAREQAAALDAERAAGRVRGPLHGLPVLVKDNFDTADMPTTAGSLALAGIEPPRWDAAVVQRLRAAGCVILGKTNMSEWARMRGRAMIAGWSGYGGQTHNPYALDYSPGGSSSGSAAAVAARLAPLAIGSETNGSIIGPASLDGVVGIKPTAQLVPSDGMVPLAPSQDTAGTMALTVSAAAAGLTVISGGFADYAAICAAEGATDLSGVRIGVARAPHWEFSAGTERVNEQALGLLSASGATLVDNLVLPPPPQWAEPFVVLKYQFKYYVERYLRTRPDAPQTLDELIAATRRTPTQYLGEEYLEAAAATVGLHPAEHWEARETLRRFGGDSIDNLLRDHDLDALVVPVRGPAWPIDPERGDEPAPGTTSHAAFAGYPMIAVPAGLVGGLPVGIAFTGTARSEATLVRVAHAFEVARTKAHGPFPEPQLTRVPDPSAAQVAFGGQTRAGGPARVQTGLRAPGRPAAGSSGVELS